MFSWINKIKIRIMDFVNRYPIVFMALVIIIFSLPCLNYHTISNTDEFSALAVPAYFAGYQWDINATWHGYGFTILFTPIFFIFNSFTVIYRIILVGVLLLLIGCACFIYKILKRFLGMDTRNAVAGALLYCVGAMSPYSEIPLSANSEVPFTFLFLLSVYLIFCAVEKEGKLGACLSILCGISMAYSSLIHSRALLMYVAVMITSIFITFLMKKKFKNILLIFLALMIAAIVFQMLDDKITGLVYNTDTIANSTSTVTGKIGKLFDVRRIYTGFKTFLCLNANIALYSCGISIFAVISAGVVLIDNLKYRQYNYYKLFLACLGLIGFLGMNYAISMDSVGPVNSGNYRWLSYIRYCRPFFGPLFIIMYEWLRTRKQSKAINWLVMAVLAGNVILVLEVLVPILSQSGYGLSYNILGHTQLAGIVGGVEDFYAIMLKLLLVIMGIEITVMRNKKSGFILASYFLFSCWIYFDFSRYYYYRDADNISKISGSVNFVSEIEDDTDIYYYGSTKYSYILRLALPDKKLNLSAEDKIEEAGENAVIITDKKSMGKYFEYTVALSDKEFAGTNSQNLYQLYLRKYADDDKK